MKKLLFIAPCLSFAGAEKILYWVASELGARGYESHILNLNLITNNSNFVIDADRDKVIIHTLPQYNKKGLNNYFRIRYMIKLIKEIGDCIVIPFTRYPCIISVIAGKLGKVPVIISERGDPYQYMDGMKNKVTSIILNSADGCVFQTRGAQKAYKEKLQKKSVIIPNPIFLNEQIEPLPQSERDKTIVSVGRFENRQKRYDLMLEAFKIFYSRHSQYRLIIYGKGPDEEQIRRWAQETGVGNAIEFMGLTQHACRDINSNGIFLITSDYEGIPNVLLEAMAVGMPVVSTDCSPGGAALLIHDHENGLLVPAGDPEAIANALGCFADDLALAERCGKKALDVLVDYAPDHLIEKWENYLNRFFVK